MNCSISLPSHSLDVGHSVFYPRLSLKFPWPISVFLDVFAVFLVLPDHGHHIVAQNVRKKFRAYQIFILRLKRWLIIGGIAHIQWPSKLVYAPPLFPTHSFVSVDIIHQISQPYCTGHNTYNNNGYLMSGYLTSWTRLCNQTDYFHSIYLGVDG